MKVCKKCKKQVSNKTKICKYCGADVSKAKIITNPKQENKTLPKQQENKAKEQEQTNLKEEIKTEKIEIKEEKKKKTKDKKEKSKNDNKAKTKEKDKKKEKQKDKKIVYRNFNKSKHQKNNTTKTKKKKEVKETSQVEKEKSPKKKKIVLAIIITLLALTLISITAGAYLLTSKQNKIIPGKQNQNTIFNFNEIINYKDVNYRVTEVISSSGTNYKKPKKGNEYVVVTVEYENKSDKKVKYSYKNWKMSNSKEEEKSRIFAPVNADKALYTGNLVVGGVKTGSMVFEQPINDEKLELHFYEEEDLEKEDKKPIFTIKIPKTNTPTK